VVIQAGAGSGHPGQFNRAGGGRLVQAEAGFLLGHGNRAAVTRTGSFPITAKNAFRSNATARSVFGRHRPATGVVMC